MCLTLPVQICKIINKDKAQVVSMGKKININTTLLRKLKIGDWILVQANLAINKISKIEAKEINKLFKRN